MSSSEIVQKLWNLCDILRDDGINYSDYVTELVLLLFIKMEYEQAEAETQFEHKLPQGYRWPELNSQSGLNLLNFYKRLLLVLSTGIEEQIVSDTNGNPVLDEKGQPQREKVTIVSDPLILAIYADAQTRLREPKHLEQLIKALDGIDWFSARRDGLGDLYEGLLEKNASETKSGAGQYFTPRALIDSIVRCIQPQPKEIIQDPAAGTAGFLIAADAYIKAQSNDLYDLDSKDQAFQRQQAFMGMELVPNTRRLALMNCLLHGMEGDAEGVVHLGNTLGDAGEKLPQAHLILTNPPFGTAKGGGGPTRSFTYKTSNKQLAFVQHIVRSLKPCGRAAVVLPDNVLFEAGVGTDIRRDLMHKCDLHTILRLPTGIFYAQGVKTNVLFFTKGTAQNPEQEENCTEHVWIYDLRTNMPSFGKRTPFSETHLKPFEQVYAQAPRSEGEWSFVEAEQSLENSRWRVFSRDWITAQKSDSLDISWIKSQDSVDASDLPEPEVLAAEAMGELTEALRELDGLMAALGAGEQALAQRELLAEVLGLELKPV
jgi:type I restriction enzyme M protein